MNQTGYAIVDIVMIIVTLGSLWRRQWVPLALYVIADALYVYVLLRYDRATGWDDLADLAILMAVVAPIYLVATIIWLFGRPRKRKRKA